METWIKAFCVAVIVAVSPIAAFAAISIPFTVNLSEAVTVDITGGTPRIAVDVGGVARYATYTAGTGTSALTFTYDAAIGDVDLDGVALSSPIDLNGGTIKDIAGNDATLTFTPPNTTGVKVNYPSLSMDFVADADGRYTLNGTVYNDLSSFLTAAGGTFSRASIGTYYDSAGILQTASANQPRFDYDPLTLQPKGILIEEQRTNTGLFPPIGSGWRSPFSNANHNGISTNSSVIAPDGRFAAVYTWTTTAVTGQNSVRVISGTISRTLGLKAVLDVYIGGNSSDTTAALGIFSNVTAWGNNTDTIYSILSGPGLFAGQFGGLISINNLSATQLTHIRITRTATTTENFSSFWYPKNSGSLQIGTATGMIAMPQFEAGAFPTSYIPTTTAAATRQQDIFTVPVGTWFNTAKGTLYNKSVVGNLGGTLPRRTIDLSDGTVANNIRLFIDDAGADGLRGSIFTLGAGVFNSSDGVAIINTPFQQAIAYEENNARTSMNGTLGVLDTSVAVPAISNIYLGNFTSIALNGNIQKAKYYPARISDTQIQLMTQ